jgi:hypothetical protein
VTPETVLNALVCFLKEALFLAIVEGQVQQGKQPNQKHQKQRKFTKSYLRNEYQIFSNKGTRPTC